MHTQKAIKLHGTIKHINKTFISAPHLCSNQIWTELNNNNLALDEEFLLTDRDYCVFCCFALWLSTQVTKRRVIRRKYQISIWHLEFTPIWHIASSVLNENVFTPVRISLFRCSRYMVLVLTDTDETRHWGIYSTYTVISRPRRAEGCSFPKEVFTRECFPEYYYPHKWPRKDCLEKY